MWSGASRASVLGGGGCSSEGAMPRFRVLPHEAFLFCLKEDRPARLGGLEE